MTTTALLLAWAVVGTIFTIAFGVGCHTLGQMVREARAETSRALEVRDTVHMREIIDERERATLMITHERERHTAEVERLNDIHAKALDRVLHMVSYGSPEPKPAEVKDAEPDAETRLIAGISEDMIHVGATRIQREYEKIGQIVSLEECEAEARAMAYGLTPDIPEERMGRGLFLRDGPPAVELVREEGVGDGAS